MWQQAWKFLNSALGIWLLTSVVGGLGIWQFERYIDARDRERRLEERFDRLALEYEGRLSQYSEWFLSLLEASDEPENQRSLTLEARGEPRIQRFLTCVSPNLLRHSIKTLSGKPNFSNNIPPRARGQCESYPAFQAIFDEFSDMSTLGVLIEIRIISEKLFPVAFNIDPETNARKPIKNVTHYKFRDRVLRAINDFLNPDAIVPIRAKDLYRFTFQQYRKAFEESFYGIGPGELWYGDVFAG